MINSLLSDVDDLTTLKSSIKMSIVGMPYQGKMKGWSTSLVID
jgi:hypothetical protein